MDQDKLDALKAEFAKEREICSGANASEYHKKKFADLGKQLGIETKKADEPKAKKQTVETTEATTATEETTVVSTTESTN